MPSEPNSPHGSPPATAPQGLAYPSHHPPGTNGNPGGPPTGPDGPDGTGPPGVGVPHAYPNPYFPHPGMPPPQEGGPDGQDRPGEGQQPGMPGGMVAMPMYPGMPGYMYPYPPGMVPPQPSKPKRRQVKNACTNCQKACKKCDETRPCTRCVKYGIADDCLDSQRKERKKGIKRGPYKKRENKGSGQEMHEEALLVMPNGATDANGQPLPYPMAYPPGIFGQFPGQPMAKPDGNAYYPQYYLTAVAHGNGGPVPGGSGGPGEGEGMPGPGQFYPIPGMYPTPFGQPYYPPHRGEGGQPYPAPPAPYGGRPPGEGDDSPQADKPKRKAAGRKKNIEEDDEYEDEDDELGPKDPPKKTKRQLASEKNAGGVKADE